MSAFTPAHWICGVETVYLWALFKEPWIYIGAIIEIRFIRKQAYVLSKKEQVLGTRRMSPPFLGVGNRENNSSAVDLKMFYIWPYWAWASNKVSCITLNIWSLCALGKDVNWKRIWELESKTWWLQVVSPEWNRQDRNLPIVHPIATAYVGLISL